MKTLLFLALLLSAPWCAAQNNRQIIRGVVVDKLSQAPLAGATVQIINTTEIKGAIADEKGSFAMYDLTPDRYDVKISYMGYKSSVVANVLVISGKETALEIALEEDLRLLKEVVITGSENHKTVNDGAVTSARAFTPEDVNRYAGGRSDPARLAANFAGVSAPDDSRNDIIIRGNSPVGVLWRMNEMNVTNPNHFASVGTTGGAVSAINTNILKSSDFLTSAFPAEYGNATSGVFDLGFRNGNSHRRETTLQAGVITGLEATTEGSIQQENGSSYIVGYRYALAGIAQKAGIDIGTTATPSYQDLSWNVNSGNTSFGRVTLFGIVASSSINIAGGNSGSLYGGGSGHDLSSNIDIIGVNYFKQLDNTSFLRSTLGWNYSASAQTDYGYDHRTNAEYAREENEVARSGHSMAISYNAKAHPRLFVKAGIQDELIGVKLYYRTREPIQSEWRQIWDEDGTTNLFQSYLHAKYSIRDDLLLTAGTHVQVLFLNNAVSVEPRLGIKWDITSANSLTFAYGLHSQMQPINVYYLQTQQDDGSYSSTNANLGFTKSHHFVLGYNVLPFADWHVKTEAYYQYLYNVPVISHAGAYSMLNTGASFRPDLEDSLINSGTGRNYGVECTVEKYFSNGYYGLCTASLYDARYTASDGIERNTAFNGRYVLNLLLGKEWMLGVDKLTADLKITRAGGRSFTPIDLAASAGAGREVLYDDLYANTERYPDYFRLDFKVSYTINSASTKFSHSLSLDLQNCTNNKNVFSYSYDERSRSIRTTYQLGFFPNVTYKLQF
jgi:hypothetical protein